MVQSQLKNVRQIVSSARAFAAILEDSSVVTWGDPENGGDCSAVRDRLKLAGIEGVRGNPPQPRKNVVHIHSTYGAFAAILEGGTVVTWGYPSDGGDMSDVKEQLHSVQRVASTASAFAAIRSDGSVVTWGHPERGGDSSRVQKGLKADGELVTWGTHGGALGGEAPAELRDVQSMKASGAGADVSIGNSAFLNINFATPLRWILQTGATFTTQSKKKEHMEENLNIFDFELSQEEVNKLSDISQSMTGKLSAAADIVIPVGGAVGGAALLSSFLDSWDKQADQNDAVIRAKMKKEEEEDKAKAKRKEEEEEEDDGALGSQIAFIRKDESAADGPKNSKKRFRVTNHCSGAIWIQSAGNQLPFDSALVKIEPGGSYSYSVPSEGVPSTRFLPKTGCDETGNNCDVQSVPPCPAEGCSPPIDTKLGSSERIS
eukprot:s553_g10.t1